MFGLKLSVNQLIAILATYSNFWLPPRTDGCMWFRSTCLCQISLAQLSCILDIHMQMCGTSFCWPTGKCGICKRNSTVQYSTAQPQSNLKTSDITLITDFRRQMDSFVHHSVTLTSLFPTLCSVTSAGKCWKLLTGTCVFVFLRHLCFYQMPCILLLKHIQQPIRLCVHHSGRLFKSANVNNLFHSVWYFHCLKKFWGFSLWVSASIFSVFKKIQRTFSLYKNTRQEVANNITWYTNTHTHIHSQWALRHFLPLNWEKPVSLWLPNTVRTQWQSLSVSLPPFRHSLTLWLHLFVRMDSVLTTTGGGRGALVPTQCWVS